jgi:hypothetical protein
MNLQRFTWAASFAAGIVSCEPAVANSINVALGVGGTIIVGQSYNENRAVDITVAGPHNLHVRSMRLDGLRAYGSSATLGARIYNSGCAVVASGFATAPGVPGGYTTPVRIPISATLAVGHSYRLAVDVLTSPPYQGSGDFFSPSRLPYIEPSRNMRINNASDGLIGACPTTPNLFVPRITVVVGPPFAGTPGSSNCQGQSVAALTREFGSISAATVALSYPSPRALEVAISMFCQASPFRSIK